jgi:hypothetical protein
LTVSNFIFSNVVGIITGVFTPYMLNPDAWNWSNYVGFFWVSPHAQFLDLFFSCLGGSRLSLARINANS